MKKFKFSLAAVLKISKMEKEQAEIEFAKAAHQLIQQKEKLSAYHMEVERGMHDYYQLSKEKITVDTLTSYSGYFETMRERIKKQQQVILNAEQFRTEKLDVLQVAMRKLKSIEQLREKKLEKFKAEQLAVEQKELDEIGLQIYMRTAR